MLYRGMNGAGEWALSLPVGVLRGFGRLLILDPSGVRQAGAMVAGAAYVAGSYVRASVATPRPR